MTERDVYVLGVGMSRFGQPGLPLGDHAFTAAVEALDDANVRFTEVDTVVLGCVFAPPTFGVRVVKDLGLTGVPILRAENASATGAAAFYQAIESVACGRSEVSLALGYDDPAMLGGVNSFEATSMAMPLSEAVINPAAFFAFWANRRMHERGTTIETLAMIAAKNWNHARHNPKAERQASSEVTVEQCLRSRMIAYPHTARMAAPQGAGGAAVIVGSREALATYASPTRAIRVAASEAHSETYVDGHLFAGAIVGPPEMAHRAAFAAYEAAGLGPEQLDLVAVHDAYAIEELLYYEEIGLCATGDGDRMVHDGETVIGGRIPVSTDGGFIGRGHPAGPTGLAQIWELTHQLRGTAGARQVEGARAGLAHIVGAGSTCFAHILTSDSSAGGSRLRTQPTGDRDGN